MAHTTPPLDLKPSPNARDEVGIQHKGHDHKSRRTPIIEDSAKLLARNELNID